MDGDKVTGDKSGTAVLDCISTFVSVIPLDIFKMTSGQFHAIFVVIKIIANIYSGNWAANMKVFCLLSLVMSKCFWLA